MSKPPGIQHYSWVMIMALAPTHMHPTDIRPLITKYKHHGSHADSRALWTHAFKALPDIDIPNDYKVISKRRLTKRNRDQSTDTWHTHTRNGHTTTDSPRAWYGQRLQRYYIHKHPMSSGKKQSNNTKNLIATKHRSLDFCLPLTAIQTKPVIKDKDRQTRE